MFDNIGKKIKTWASVTAWIGIITSIIIGLVLMITKFFVGFLVAVLGSIAAWVGSFVLYGLGQLIDNSDLLVEAAKIEHPELGGQAAHQPVVPVQQSPQAQQISMQDVDNIVIDPSKPWVCSNCATKNPPNTPYCRYCNVSMEWSERRRVRQ